jgi:hypothetical protein
MVISSQTTKFNTQNLSLLAYGGRSFVKTGLNVFSHAAIVVFEVETSMDWIRFPVNLGGSVVSSLMTRISSKGIELSDSVSIVNWMVGLKVLRWLREFCNSSGL